MNRIASTIAGLTMAFTAAASEASAQSIQLDLGNGSLRLDFNQGYYNDEPVYRERHRPRRERRWNYDPETGEYYRRHPSQNNVKCWNIPNNGPHGGTHRVCDNGYDSRYN